MTVGANIRRFRKEKGWTQSQLADKLRVSQQMIGQFENNKNPPKIETVEKIASALGVTAFDLMGADYWDSKYPNMNKEVAELELFKGFLESIGYTVSFSSAGREGKTFIADLSKDDVKIEFTQAEFEDFRQETKKTVDYQIWQKSHEKK